MYIKRERLVHNLSIFKGIFYKPNEILVLFMKWNFAFLVKMTKNIIINEPSLKEHFFWCV